MVYSALKGRIGNNLFQIAAGISLAKQNNTDFAAYIRKIMLPEPDNCLLSEYLNQFRDNILRKIILFSEIPGNFTKYFEPNNNFTQIRYHKNICLDGYFQSEKYFDKDLVRDIYSIDDTSLKYIRNKYGFLFNEEIISITVRRGDLLKIPHYIPVCSLRFYKNAINYFGNDKRYLIISDDIEWCKKNFVKGEYFFIEDETPVIDLYLQTFCANNIISNSTFSWWGAWLNPNADKIVIAPSENWVGKLYPVQNTVDLLPEDWITVANPLTYKNRITVFYKKVIQLLVRIRKVLKKKPETHNG